MSASVITLAQLRDRVEVTLMDTGNAVWPTGTIDAGIRLALDEFSKVRPLIAKSDLALSGKLSTNGREIDISSISDLTGIEAVWGPHLAADDLPTVRGFDHWIEEEIIYLSQGSALSSGDTARIFYQKRHTLNGLDGEGTTSFLDGVESILELGAVGYSLLSRSVDLAEQITIDRDTVEEIQNLGELYLKLFVQAMALGV